jgi:DNA-binding CsgD family transcriptional regulator
MIGQPPPSALAELNDRELEILRLLTAGHTVKSIAVQLGRSEASINERLRDARRKTGVGSSRELARMVDAMKFGDAQKNWDRKIDLPAERSGADDLEPPATAGRSRSKGTIAMLTALPALAAGLLAMAASSTQHVPPVQPPLAGTWSLDTTRIPADERPRSVTISFRTAPDGKWTTVVDIVAPDGATQHAESTAATDGVAVPVTGNMPFIDTVLLRQPSPNSLVMTLGKDGAAVSTRVYTVTRDRKAMTETIVWAGGAMPKLETTYFNRIG